MERKQMKGKFNLSYEKDGNFFCKNCNHIKDYSDDTCYECVMISTTKCKKCKNNFENPGYNPNMDLDLCPDCNLEIEEKIEEMNDLTRNVKIN